MPLVTNTLYQNFTMRQANMPNVEHRSSGMELHMLRAQATKVKAHVELLHERKLCFDTVLQVPSHTLTLHEHVYV